MTNLFIDGANLLITAWVAEFVPMVADCCWLRSSASMYAVMMIFPALSSFLFTVVIKCIFSVVMLLTAFGYVSVQHFFRHIGRILSRQFRRCWRSVRIALFV